MRSGLTYFGKYRQSIWKMCTMRQCGVSSNIEDGLLLEAEPRRFNNLYIDLSMQQMDSFEQKLDFSISKWQNDKIRALWAYLPTHKSYLIPILVQVCDYVCFSYLDVVNNVYKYKMREDLIFIMQARDLWY